MLVRDILRLGLRRQQGGGILPGGDKRFSPINAYMANTLFDENHGGGHGSCHIALGAGLRQHIHRRGPRSQWRRPANWATTTSALHWDLVNTEQKEVYALLKGGGKELIYEKGEFTLS